MTGIAEARMNIQYALNYSTALVNGNAVYDADEAQAAAVRARDAAKTLEKSDPTAAFSAGKAADMLDRIKFDGATTPRGHADAIYAVQYLRQAAIDAA